MERLNFNLQRFAVYGTAGNDTLMNTVSNAPVYGYAGNDSIYNISADGATLIGGDGSDTIVNVYDDGGDYVSISGGAGNDYIYDSYSWYSTLDGGDGADVIISSSNYSKIFGGNGNDSINLTGSRYITVNAGAGDDTIRGGNFAVYQYASGSGNDVIYGYTSNSRISLGGGYYTRETVSNDVVVSLVSGGSMTLKNARSKTVNIVGGTVKTDVISNSNNNTIVNGTANADKISNTGSTVKIYAGAGNDSIYSSGYPATVDAGDGNDTILGRWSSSLSGGAGNDVISLTGGDVDSASILGGLGDDTIYSDNVDGLNYIQYRLGDGYDVIYNTRSGDRISITGGVYTRATVGGNVILSVYANGAAAPSGAMTIIGGTNTNVMPGTIYGTIKPVSSGVTLNNTLSGVSLSGTGYADSIKNSGGRVTIYGGDGNDTVSNSAATVKVYAGAGNDSIYSSSNYITVDAGDGNDTIVGRTWDSSLSGGAGNDVIMLNGGDVDRASILGGLGDDTIYSDNVDGLNYIQYRLGDGYDVIYNTRSGDRISITGGVYTRSTVGSNVILSVYANGAAAPSGAMTIIGGTNTSVMPGTIYGTIKPNSSGVTLNNTLSGVSLSGTGYADSIKNSGNRVTIYGGDGNDTLYNSAATVKVYAGAGNDSIYSSSNYVTVDAGDGNDTIVGRTWDSSLSGGAGNDVISLGSGDVDRASILGGLGDDTIYSDNVDGWNYIQYRLGDGYDVLRNTRSNDRISITGGVYTRSTVGGNVILSVYANGAAAPSGAMTIVGGTNTSVMPSVIGTARALGVTLNNTLSGVSLSGTGYADSLKNSGNRVTIYGGDGNDTIYNRLSSYSSNSYVSIIGGAGNDSIYNVYGSAATIDAGVGNDTIYDSSWYSSINGGAGADSIYMSSTYDTVNGGDDNDTIMVYGGANSLNGGAGADIISLTGSYSAYRTSTITGGTGNDTIYLNSATTIGNIYQYNAGDGNDLIRGITNYDTISIGGGTYTRSTDGTNVILSVSGGGAMTIVGASGKSFKVQGTPAGGGVTINNTLSGVSLNGTDYADSIKNSGSRVAIYAGAGNDSIYSSGYPATVDAGDGNDTIIGRTWDSSLSGGAGNDVISLGSGDVDGASILGGLGDDTIYSDNVDGWNYIQYRLGDGYDVLRNTRINDRISITGGVYTRSTVGGNVVLNVYANNSNYASGAMTIVGGTNSSVMPSVIGTARALGVTLNNTLSGVSLNGSSYADSIKNSGGRVSIYGGDGNDTLYNTAATVKVYAGAGNDSIYSNNNTHSNAYVTIDAGAGNDTIVGRFGDSSINAGEGNDFISLSSDVDRATIRGGAGNDTIYNDGYLGYDGQQVFQYANGDGYDVIYGIHSNDTISIESGVYSTVASGSNVIVNVYNNNSASAASGAITLNGASGKSLNIRGTRKNVTPTDHTPQEIIKSFMGVLDTVTSSGISAVNRAVSIASGGYFTSAQAVIDKMVRDRNSSTNGTTFLQNYCDINLNNTDTGAITGSDAGGSTTKTAESIIPETAPLTNFTGSFFTVNGLNVYLADVNRDNGNVSRVLTYNDLTNDQKNFWKGLYSWWIGGALDLIAESYGNNYGFSSAASANTHNCYIYFYTDNSSNTRAAMRSGNSSGVIYKINMKYYNNIDLSNPSGRSASDSLYFDRLTAHEFTHAVMGSNINNFHDLPTYIKEGMAELTHGIDDDRGSDILSLVANTSRMRQALVDRSDYFDVANVWSPSYVGGYTFLRYLAKQASENYGLRSSGNAANSAADTGISISGKTLTVKDSFSGTVDLNEYASTVTKINASKAVEGLMIIGNEENNSVRGGAGNDTISGNTGNDTLRGGAGNDEIYGDAGDDVLKGEAGNDTLFGSENDTLTGGAGSDIFIYSNYKGGNGVITDYAAEDTISVANFISQTVYSGNDVVFHIGEGTLTVKNAKNKNITLIEEGGAHADYVNEYDLFDDDNFIGSGAELDEIAELTADNYSAGNIETLNFNDIAQTQPTLAAYNHEK